MASEEHKGRDGPPSIDELLRELAELRELDRSRNAHVRGSRADIIASRDIEDRTRRLMDRFRDWKTLPADRIATRVHLARPPRGHTIGSTRTG